MLHQTRLGDILWQHVLSQWIPRHQWIQGITEMTPPQTKQELQSFLGAVNYLQTFVPHLSHHTQPLCALLKKENSFAWDENSNTSFQQIKSLLQKALLKPLKYNNRNKPVTLQCDASLKGLRACIIQDGHPIGFASKSLTDTETWYANIERELLAIVYGYEKFHTCTVEHFRSKQTTNCWRWSVWRILLQPQLGYRGCFSECNSMTWKLRTDQIRRCSWLMPWSSSASELMPYPCQLSQGAAWWRLQQKHN